MDFDMHNTAAPAPQTGYRLAIEKVSKQHQKERPPIFREEKIN